MALVNDEINSWTEFVGALIVLFWLLALVVAIVAIPFKIISWAFS